MKKMKKILKNSQLTHGIYMFLYTWKYDGFDNALLTLNKKKTASSSPSSVSIPQIQSKPGLNMDTYKLPDILLQNDNAIKKIVIYFCANTIYAPEKGHSGGPGTVLATLKNIIGPSYKEHSCHYIFENKPSRPAHLQYALNEIPISNRFFIAAFAIEHGLDIWKNLDRYTQYLFICHDVGTAYGAYLRNCRYVLVYHQQGALVSERLSNGDTLNERDIEMANAVEETVFYNAAKVYFPSLGAREAFRVSTHIDCSKVNFADEALYNTIPDNTLSPSLYDELIKDFKLTEQERDSTDVFLSIGDFSYNKGIDRIPEFLTQYYQRTKKNIYWIAIGRKLGSGIFERMQKEKESWPFKVCLLGERINHDIILALMDYSDYYIMLHRFSIFDLSTLEAMRAGNAIILSNVNGNPEYNKEDNIVLVDPEDYSNALDELTSRDKQEMSVLNQPLFEKCFSKQHYYDAYTKMLDNQIHEMQRN